MRAHVIRDYASVIDALGERGCPVCVFLQNEQERLVQNAHEFATFCNFHGWAIAATVDAPGAANVFLKLLASGTSALDLPERPCDICSRLSAYEHSAWSDLSSAGHQHVFTSWLIGHGTLCEPHASIIKKRVPLKLASLIDQAGFRKTRELTRAFRDLQTSSESEPPQHSGAIGQAAEYLLSQRGLSIW